MGVYVYQAGQPDHAHGRLPKGARARHKKARSGKDRAAGIALFPLCDYLFSRRRRKSFFSSSRDYALELNGSMDAGQGQKTENWLLA
jgi:hypothetical protein